MSNDIQTRTILLNSLDQMKTLISSSIGNDSLSGTSDIQRGGGSLAGGEQPGFGGEDAGFSGEVTTTPELADECRKFALLVGIDSYTAQGHHDPKPFGNFGPLTGCVEDVKRMRDMLVNRFGYKKRDIQLLLNGDATKERILKKFERLADKAKPGDAVVVGFSGHGTQIADQIPLDENNDHLDEAIVPVNYSEGLVRDDEIRTRFKKINPKEVNLAFLVDSCHSGTGIRSEDGLVAYRTGNLGTATAGYKQVVKAGMKALNIKAPDKAPPLVEGHLLLSASKADQYAREYRDGRQGGVFTGELVNAAQPGMTYQMLFEKVAPAVTRIVQIELNDGLQEPQIEGLFKTRKIFECIPVAVKGPF